VTEIESESKSELDKEAKELLNQMFPNVDDEILVDFLIKYDNNVARVTDILLDSICFEEIKKESDKPKPKRVKSLKTLCNEIMEKLELQFENLYENSSNVDICFSLKEEEEERSIVEDISSSSNVENEPIFSFNLDRDFLSSLIKIFGEKDEEKYLNGKVF
jgi:dihydroneopterin aldolase